MIRAIKLCLPEEYKSPLVWDGANNTVFRPVARFFAVDPGGEAVNVNSLDEVPDSSWFVNRIGKSPMTPEELARGSCEGPPLDANAPDGSWLIDQGKADGANPGFRIRVNGKKFLLKADRAEQPERATGATAIATRLYYAAGWWAPCDSSRLSAAIAAEAEARAHLHRQHQRDPTVRRSRARQGARERFTPRRADPDGGVAVAARAHDRALQVRGHARRRSQRRDQSRRSA